MKGEVRIMGSYTPDLGFVPTTNEENIEQLKTYAADKIDLDVQSTQEFMLSNFWLVYYAVSRLKEQIDGEILTVIEQNFNFFKEQYGSLEPKKGTSFLGLQNILTECSEQYEIETYHNNVDIQAAECRIALLNEDVELLTEQIGDWFDFSTSTTPQALPTPSQSININIPPNNFTFHYELAYATELEIDIKYRRLDTYIVQGGEDKRVLDAFLAKWNEWQTLGKDFEPDVYLSNDVIEFLADFTIGYKKDGDIGYTYEKLDHQFGEYFTIKEQSGIPLILVEDIT